MGDAELINALNDLADKLESLSKRYVTPLESSLAVQGRTNKITMEIIAGVNNDLESTATYYGLAYNGSDLYTYDSDGSYAGKIIKYNKTTGEVTEFVTVAKETRTIIYDSDRSEVITFDYDSPYTMRVYNTNGEVVRTSSIEDTRRILAGCYDGDASKVYVTYYEGATYYYATISTFTGAMSSEVALSGIAVLDMEYALNQFYFSVASYYEVVLPGASTSYITIDKPSSGPTYYIEYDSSRNLFFTQDQTSNDYNTLVSPNSVQKFSIYDDGGVSITVDDGGSSLSVDDGGSTISVDDGGSTISIDDDGSTISIDDGEGSITVDGLVTAAIQVSDDMNYDTVTITNAAGGTQIVATNSSRKGIVIINADASNSVYLGGDASVATSNGLELPAGAYVVYTNYTRVVHAIAENSPVDVRYNELIKT
ncbi:MAG: hypothetical protein ACTSPB_17190 [Candidatus Thorarchaeota archaeon]